VNDTTDINSGSTTQVIHGDPPRPRLDRRGRVLLGSKRQDSPRQEEALELGRVAERPAMGDGYHQRQALLDTRYPHVASVLGARASGKTRMMARVISGLLEHGHAPGVLALDGTGDLSSLLAREVPRVRRLAPAGVAQKLASTGRVDGAVAIDPCHLTGEAWASALGIADPFSEPRGLLLQQVVQDLRQVRRPYSLGDMIALARQPEEGGGHRFKGQTVAAVVRYLRDAARWGIFASPGLRSRQLVRAGWATVIDLSAELPRAAGGLLASTLIRDLLGARVQAVSEARTGCPGRQAPPPTWLVVDGAPGIGPGRGAGGAGLDDALSAYARHGRVAGCALLLTSRTPAAIPPDVLSQSDLVFVFKTLQASHVKASVRNLPAELSDEMRLPSFFRALPAGTALVADASTPERALVVDTTPACSPAPQGSVGP